MTPEPYERILRWLDTYGSRQSVLYSVYSISCDVYKTPKPGEGLSKISVSSKKECGQPAHSQLGPESDDVYRQILRQLATVNYPMRG